MGRMIDITGQRFGRLVVLHRTDKVGTHRESIWHCRCDCGKEVDVVSTSLRQGYTKSCGCMRSEAAQRNIEKAHQWQRENHEEEVNNHVEIDRSQFDDWWMFGDFKEIERLRTMFK